MNYLNPNEEAAIDALGDALGGVNANVIEQLSAKVAELEEENARLKETLVDHGEIQKSLCENLSASQAYVEQLREALTTCVCAMQDYQAGIGITEMFDTGERLGRKALATHSDISALGINTEQK